MENQDSKVRVLLTPEALKSFSEAAKERGIDRDSVIKEYFANILGEEGEELHFILNIDKNKH